MIYQYISLINLSPSIAINFPPLQLSLRFFSELPKILRSKEEKKDDHRHVMSGFKSSGKKRESIYFTPKILGNWKRRQGDMCKGQFGSASRVKN